MKIQLSISANLPTPPELFARIIAQRAGLSGIKTSKRGTKYTASGDNVVITYDQQGGHVFVKHDGKMLLEFPAPRVGARLTSTQSTTASKRGDMLKAKLAAIGPKAGSEQARKQIKFKAKAPAKLTKEQRAEVTAKYGTALAKKVIALGTALLAIKEVKTDTGTHLMFWPFAYGPVTRKVKTLYGTIPRSDLFAMMGSAPTIAFKSVKAVEFRGFAKCRVCGINLGSATQYSATGVARPSNIAAHYRSHGVNCNLVEKVVTDKATGKLYKVLYIGSLNAL
jgi:hypothetical protein